MANKDGGLLVVPDGNKTIKPRGLITAISEIESMFSVAEMNGNIPEAALPLAATLAFFEVGFKTGLLNGIVLTIMTPLMMAAERDLLLIFGEHASASLFNQFFMISLSLAFPVCYAMFLFRTFSRCYAGTITGKAINNLIGGILTGLTIKTVIATFFFHWLYFRLLLPERISSWMVGIRDHKCLFGCFNDTDWSTKYTWMLEFREILIPAAWFVATVNLFFIALMLYSMYQGRIQTCRRAEFLREWE